ncbi:Uncharacterised protein [Glaesserella parasuis]|nr:Uncharacterised protein [Glaesserella parasuis]
MNYIGKLIRIGKSQIIELNKDVGCFFTKTALTFRLHMGYMPHAKTTKSKSTASN